MAGRTGAEGVAENRPAPFLNPALSMIESGFPACINDARINVLL